LIDHLKKYNIARLPLLYLQRGVLCMAFVLIFSLQAFAQQDTTIIIRDTLEQKSDVQITGENIPFNTDSVLKQDTMMEVQKVHSVKRATLLSTYLPGAGQVYNHKTWKVPIIYAAFAGMAYFIKFNHDNFKKFEKALLIRFDTDPNTVDNYVNVYSEDNLKSLSDFYRSNRDLSVIGMTLIYVLNIVDAHVDAHLFNFNVDDNLSLQVNPTMNYSQGISSAGLSLSLHFK